MHVCRRSAACVMLFGAALLLFFHPFVGFGQDGGNYAYAFLSLPYSPRVVGQGGKPGAVMHIPDPSVAVANVSLLGPEHHATGYLSHGIYYGGIHHSQAVYATSLPLGVMAFSFRHALYGRMPGYDEFGMPTVPFSAYDVALGVHWAYEVAPGWRVGVSMLPIFSSIAEYNSLALAFDAGVSYHTEDYRFTCSLLLRHLGVGVKGYSRGVHERTPYEVLLSFAYTLEHAPLRFFLTLQNLESYRARFMPGERPRPYYGDGGRLDVEPSLVQRLGRELLAHPILGVEIVPIRYFYLQVSFNPQRLQHYAVAGYPYASGLAWGLGVEYRRFSLNFSQSTHHPVGLTHHVSVHWRFGTEAERSLPRYESGRLPAP